MSLLLQLRLQTEQRLRLWKKLFALCLVGNICPDCYRIWGTSNLRHPAINKQLDAVYKTAIV
jgi:hypothetical protein